MYSFIVRSDTSANAKAGNEDDEEQDVKPQPEVEVPLLGVLPDQGPVVCLHVIEPLAC